MLKTGIFLSKYQKHITLPGNTLIYNPVSEMLSWVASPGIGPSLRIVRPDSHLPNSYCLAANRLISFCIYLVFLCVCEDTNWKECFYLYSPIIFEPCLGFMLHCKFETKIYTIELCQLCQRQFMGRIMWAHKIVVLECSSTNFCFY